VCIVSRSLLSRLPTGAVGRLVEKKSERRALGIPNPETPYCRIWGRLVEKNKSESTRYAVGVRGSQKCAAVPRRARI